MTLLCAALLQDPPIRQNPDKHRAKGCYSRRNIMCSLGRTTHAEWLCATSITVKSAMRPSFDRFWYRNHRHPDRSSPFSSDFESALHLDEFSGLAFSKDPSAFPAPMHFSTFIPHSSNLLHLPTSPCSTSHALLTCGTIARWSRDQIMIGNIIHDQQGVNQAIRPRVQACRRQGP